MKSKLVTIGIPCRNEENYIAECLISAIQQDIDIRYDVIVSDNASTDGTVAKIRSILDNNCRANCAVSVIENRENIGAHNNFRQVFDLAQSKYFMWLGAHDYTTKDFLRKSIDFLESKRDFSMVSGIPYRIHLKTTGTFRGTLAEVFRQPSIWIKNRRKIFAQSKKRFNAYNVVKGWKGPEVVPNAIYNFSQSSPLERYIKSVEFLVNCTIFHSLFKRDALADYDWDPAPSADHIIISRLLWNGKLGFSDAEYVRRYFPKTDYQEKKAAGSYLKNTMFFNCYLNDFEKLAKGTVDAPMLRCLSQYVFESLIGRYGYPVDKL